MTIEFTAADLRRLRLLEDLLRGRGYVQHQGFWIDPAARIATNVEIVKQEPQTIKSTTTGEQT